MRIIGRDDDGLQDELEELSASLSVSYRIRYLPHTDPRGVVDALHASDCALLPSRFESFHLAAVEALACGVPVITSDRTGVGSWIGAADGLRALPIEDSDEFAGLAAEALADASWLSHAGERGAARVRDLFPPAAIAAQLLDVYDELRERNPAGVA